MSKRKDNIIKLYDKIKDQHTPLEEAKHLSNDLRSAKNLLLTKGKRSYHNAVTVQRTQRLLNQTVNLNRSKIKVITSDAQLEN